MGVRRSIAFACLLAAQAPAVLAQTPSLVKDVTPGISPAGDASSSPRNLLAAGPHLFFTAQEPSSGRELWATDGTAVGTEMLVDLCPGDCNSDPLILGTLGGTVLFEAGGGELWRSDGTRAGTYPLTVSGSKLPTQLGVVFGGVFYFASCGADRSCGLWRTDGTPAGTRFVFGAGGESEVKALATAADRLYFATAESYVYKLWTLGPGDRTQRVADLPSAPDPFVVSGGKLFFSVADLDGGELWVSDGTPAGTRNLTGTAKLAPFQYRPALKGDAGRVYFNAAVGTGRQGLWVSDGTTTGTHAVARVAAADLFGNSALTLPPVEVLGGRIVFLTGGAFSSAPYNLWGTDGHPDSALELTKAAIDNDHPLLRLGNRMLFVADAALWSTDGTVAGTHSITGHCACGTSFLGPRLVGATAYFAAGTGGSYDLWQTDGTEAGTRRAVAHGPLSAGDGSSLEIVALGDRIYWNATSAAYGTELASAKRVPGSPGEIVANIAVGARSSRLSSLTAVGDRLIFRSGVTFGSVTNLWGSAGAADSTVPLANDQGILGVVGGLAFFDGAYSSTLAPALSRTDGTLDGTLRLTQFDSSVAPLGPAAVLGGRLFFRVASFTRREVWVSDGTPAGTVLAFTLPDPTLRIVWLGASDSTLFVGAVDPLGALQLWASDGTPAGTRRAGDPGVDGQYLDSGFLSLGSSVLFLVSVSGADRATLWTSDGTPAGTVRLATGLPPAAKVSGPVRLGGAAYLFVGAELWRTDGTAQGTSRVRDLTSNFSVSPPPPRYLTAFAGRLYFAASEAVHGTELWTSDGTEAGTMLFSDLWPGPASSTPAWLRVAGGRLFFAATDDVHGRELWASDGTAAGTALVSDLAPEGASSAPEELTVAGDRLYFSADDGLAGRELWALPLSGTGCPPGDTHLCLSAGRFQVEIAWTDFQGHNGVGHAVPLTADTGYFWFFDPKNVETVVKVLDARALNQAFWVFYGALSSVEYTMTVTDTQTGLTRRYFNPSGRFASVGDTHGFGPLGAFDTKAAGAPSRTELAAATGSCAAGAERLCLNGGRFAVTATWKDFSGHTGTGTAVALTGDTGYFWFFAPTNVEVVAKVLDGTGLNGKFWFFYGALSSVEYTLTVTDTQTGAAKTYKNASGQFASVGDTGAF